MLASGTCSLEGFKTTGGRLGKITVSQFYEAGNWNIQKLNNHAPTHKIPQILQIPINYSAHTSDKPTWTPTRSGKFTCASAYEVIRRKRWVLFTNKLTWHKKIPFKWSFCLWRDLRNKLPTGGCVCCISPQAE